jgi:NADPH2:quinone reductase
MAGYVAAVGSNVYEFRKGDKVAASHPLETPHGTYAEYSIAPEHTCFLIPPGLSFEGQYT